MVTEDELRQTFEAYRKNKQNVSPEDLKGRYRKAFGQLKDKLKSEADGYFAAMITDGMQIVDDADGYAVISRINDVLDAAHFNETAGRLIFHDCDLDGAIKFASGIREQIMTEIYEPYVKEVCNGTCGVVQELS